MRTHLSGLNSRSVGNAVILVSLLGILNGSAASIIYEWSYLGRGGAKATGTVHASGVGSDGFLLGISKMQMRFWDYSLDGWSRSIAVNDLVGWHTPDPRIPADGGTTGLTFRFDSEYRSSDFSLIIGDTGIYNGGEQSFFEAELTYMRKGWQSHEMEESGPTINWTMSPSARPVPDGGSTWLLGLIATVPLIAFAQRTKTKSTRIR